MATRCLRNWELCFQIGNYAFLLWIEQWTNLVNASVLISSSEQWLKQCIHHVTNKQPASTPIIESIGQFTNYLVWVCYYLCFKSNNINRIEMPSIHCLYKLNSSLLLAIPLSCTIQFVHCSIFVYCNVLWPPLNGHTYIIYTDWSNFGCMSKIYMQFLLWASMSLKTDNIEGNHNILDDRISKTVSR